MKPDFDGSEYRLPQAVLPGRLQWWSIERPPVVALAAGRLAQYGPGILVETADLDRTAHREQHTMIDDYAGNLVELSDTDLDLVAAANGINITLGNLVNMNIAVNVQTANQIAALTGNTLQNIGQQINVSQFVHVS